MVELLAVTGTYDTAVAEVRRAIRLDGRGYCGRKVFHRVGAGGQKSQQLGAAALQDTAKGRYLPKRRAEG